MGRSRFRASSWHKNAGLIIVSSQSGRRVCRQPRGQAVGGAAAGKVGLGADGCMYVLFVVMSRFTAASACGCRAALARVQDRGKFRFRGTGTPGRGSSRLHRVCFNPVGKPLPLRWAV